MSDRATIKAGDEVRIARTGEKGLVIEFWPDHGKWLVEMYSAGDPLELHTEDEMVVERKKR